MYETSRLRDADPEGGTTATTSRGGSPGKATLTARLPPRRAERLTRDEDDEAKEDVPAAASGREETPDDPFSLHLLGQTLPAGAAAAGARKHTHTDDERDRARKLGAEFQYALKSVKAIATPDRLKGLDPDDERARLDDAASWLEDRFTAWQRDRLHEFATTHVIPEGLFISSEADGCTALRADRILIAGHILAHGTTAASGAKDHRVHAEDCGHWVEYVWIYAGVQSAKGDSNAGQGSHRGVRGPTGTTSFGGGGANDLRAQSKSAHASDPESMGTADDTQRKAPLGWPNNDAMWKHLNSIEAGDWLYIDNGSAAMHSILVVDWKTRPVKRDGAGAIADGRIYALHQGSPAAGGTEKEFQIGYPNRSGIDPVTMISRPAADAAPPRDEASLLRYDRAAAEKATGTHIANHGLDLDKLHAALVASVDHGLTSMATLDATQRKLCAQLRDDAGGAVSLSNVVRLLALAQRVHPLSTPKGGNGRLIDGQLNLAGQDGSLLKGGFAAYQRGKGE